MSNVMGEGNDNDVNSTRAVNVRGLLLSSPLASSWSLQWLHFGSVARMEILHRHLRGNNGNICTF